MPENLHVGHILFEKYRRTKSYSNPAGYWLKKMAVKPVKVVL